jgi:hypothetical protein
MLGYSCNEFVVKTDSILSFRAISYMNRSAFTYSIRIH